MLLARTSGISPILAASAKYTNRYKYKSTSTRLLPSTATIATNRFHITLPAAQENLSYQSYRGNYVSHTPPFCVRCYASKTPSSEDLIRKERVEKYFYKTVGLLLDVIWWIYLFIKRNIEKHILQNETVLSYWKKLMQKVENARKN